VTSSGPLKDALGRKRTSANTPGARKGIPSPIAGRTFPLELLTPREVDVLLATPAKDETYDARDRAMIWLIYRCDIKLGQVVQLLRSDWDPATGVLSIPPGRLMGARTARIDPRGREVLEEWLQVRRLIPNVRVGTPLFCQIQTPASGRDVTPGAWRKSLEIRSRKSGIEKRINAEALRASGRLHAQRRTSVIGAFAEAHIDDFGFRSRHPTVHDRWQAAIELYGVNPERHAARIAQDCQAALDQFGAELALRHELDVLTDAAPLDRLNRVLRGLPLRSPAVREFLKALVAHAYGALRDIESHRDDLEVRSRRVIYNTMMVLYEVDRSLAVSTKRQT
jgi:hypothetical protein